MEDNFDFSSLTAEDIDEAPQNSGGARRKYEVNPFVQMLKEAAQKGGGKQVVVPRNAVKGSLALIRRAADELGWGSRTNLYAKGKLITQAEVSELAPNVRVTVKFWPAEKRARRRSTAEESAPETPAE